MLFLRIDEETTTPEAVTEKQSVKSKGDSSRTGARAKDKHTPRWK